MSSNKDKFFSRHWIEERCDFLGELEEEERMKLVESFDENELHSNVNIRRFQQDYIADYLEGLYGISEKAFWQHIDAMFTEDGEGILWSDNWFYMEKIQSDELPVDTFRAILDHYCDEDNPQNINAIKDIIASQVGNENNKQVLLDWSKQAKPEVKKAILEVIDKVASDEYSYAFYT